MNIEESIEILKEFRNYNKFYEEENKDLTITITLEAKESIDKAIATLLTAYEKEKDKNKKLNILRLELLIGQFPDTTETYKKYKKELDELLREE